MSLGSASISMLGFVPAIVVQYLMKLTDNKNYQRQLPEKQALRSVVMFADISGFTNLTETLSKIGPEGAEVIAFAINRYMELLVKGIGRSGGDIFKFAGDAIIVVWPPPPAKENGLPSEKDLETLCKQAIQSALEIQAKLNDTNILENIKLSVKIGFGIGDINIIHVGGVFQRTEYIATGDPLIQAFESEHCCTAGGQTIVSKQVYEMVQNFFDFRVIKGEHDDHHGEAHFEVLQPKSNYNKVKMKADALLITNTINLSNFEKIKGAIQSYIPAALIPFIEIDEESWSSELRLLTIMFVNLGIDLSDTKTDDGLQQIQKVIQTVQKCVYYHQGSLNKLLMDDKGSTLIVVFGLPPMSHQDDAIRAVLTGFSLQTQLAKIKCSCSIGIATGTVFAGVVGTSGSRREYSVLGDSVNLAARLMQTACGEKVHKIIVCENTAKHAEHKLTSVYYKSVKLKGKAFDIPLFYPVAPNSEYPTFVRQTSGENQQKSFEGSKLLDRSYIATPDINLFPELRTHRFNVPLSNSDSKAHQKALWMVGREEIHRKVQQMVDRFLKDVESKGFILIRGSHGVGKSLFLRKILYRIQEKINSNQYSFTWKYNEKQRILVQSLNPITKDYPLCGLRNILKGIFKFLAERENCPADINLLQRIIKKTCHEKKDRKPQSQIHKQQETYDAYTLLQEILELKPFNPLDVFPMVKHNITDKDSRKAFTRDLKLIIIQFLGAYFEEIPEKYIRMIESDNILEEVDESGESDRPVRTSLKQPFQRTSHLGGNIIAPILFCLDDMQNYDEYSFCIIKLMMRSFNKIMMIGLLRDQFLDSGLKGTKTQEDIYIQSIQAIESVVEARQFHSFVLRGLSRLEKEDEFLKLLKATFNFSRFGQSNKERASDSFRSPMDQQQQEQRDLVLQNHYLFFENKQTLLTRDQNLLFLHSIYLKTSGNANMVINLVQSLIDQKLLQLQNGQAQMAPQLRYILDNEEWLTVDAPLCRIQVNGPIIDRLSCMESLIMKAASVIGEIFDIQTLNKVQPLRNGINQEKLAKLLNELVTKELLEVMNVTEYNTYYRFCHPFMRECLYQRMTFKQRRGIHLNVAETILPLINESEEEMENKKQEFQWRMAESKWSLDEDETTKQNAYLNSGLKHMSHKALRSIIVRQIQNRLAKFHNDYNTIIKEGNLEKKSEKNITWAIRYCVMDSREFRFYYTQKDSQDHNVQPLCTILLKNINAIVPLQGKDGKPNAFYINCSSWYKKNRELNERKFYFAAMDEQLLQQWSIFLEFARAKAIYEEFVSNFGKIQFPIGSPIASFDMQFKNDVHMKKRIQYISQNSAQQGSDKNSSTSKGSIVTRNSRSSKFMVHRQQTKLVQRDHDEYQQNLQNSAVDFSLIKERLSVFLKKSTLLFYSHLFDMAIQRQDEYKTFGQTNSAMKKLTAYFKIEKKLCQIENNNLNKSSTGRASQISDLVVEQIARQESQFLNSPQQAAQAKLQQIEEDFEQSESSEKDKDKDKKSAALEQAVKQAPLQLDKEPQYERYEKQTTLSPLVQFQSFNYMNLNAHEQKDLKEIKELPRKSQTEQKPFIQFGSSRLSRKSDQFSQGSLGDNLNHHSAKGSIMIRHSIVEHINEEGNESVASAKNRPFDIQVYEANNNDMLGISPIAKEVEVSLDLDRPKAQRVTIETQTQTPLEVAPNHFENQSQSQMIPEYYPRQYIMPLHQHMIQTSSISPPLMHSAIHTPPMYPYVPPFITHSNLMDPQYHQMQSQIYSQVPQQPIHEEVQKSQRMKNSSKSPVVKKSPVGKKSKPKKQTRTYFGVAKHQSTSLRGDIFTLDAGQKVLVTKIYKERGFLECSSNGNSGIFRIDDISVTKQ